MRNTRYELLAEDLEKQKTEESNALEEFEQPSGPPLNVGVRGLPEFYV